MRGLLGVPLVLAAAWPPVKEIPKEELPKSFCEFERSVIQPCAQMRGDINKQMTKGIDGSAVVVAFITKRYTAKVDGEGAAGMNDASSPASNHNQGLDSMQSRRSHQCHSCTELQV